MHLLARRSLNGFAVSAIMLFVSALPAAPADLGPGAIVEAVYTDTFLPHEIRRMSAAFFEGFDASRARYAVRSYHLRYMSTDFDGSQAEITAQLFVPLHASPAERPMLVFGSGTTGLADECAPSRVEFNSARWENYRLNMLAYAGEGFVTVFPDYLGFNDPQRTQRYFSKAAEAHVMLDAARAARSFLETAGLPARPSNFVFTAGYSQGGHAAFAAADYRAHYAPEVPLTGVIGFGATTDVATLLQEGPCYAPYILQSYTEMYGDAEIDASRVFQGQWAASLAADAGRMNVDEAQRYYPANPWRLYLPEFLRALQGDTLRDHYPALHSRLEENRSGLDGHGLPALIVHGRADTVISTWSQTRFVRELGRAGSEVQYTLLDGVSHRHTRAAGFRASVEWMSGLVAAQASPAVAPAAGADLAAGPQARSSRGE